MVSEQAIVTIVFILLLSLILIYLISNLIFRTYFYNKLKYKKDLSKLKWEIENGVSK